jgi:hypothetical protein
MAPRKVIFSSLGSRVVTSPEEEGFKLSEATVYGNKITLEYRDQRVRLEINGKMVRFPLTAVPVVTCEQAVMMLDNPLYTWKLLYPLVEGSDLEKRAVTALIKRVGGYEEEEV